MSSLGDDVSISLSASSSCNDLNEFSDNLHQLNSAQQDYFAPINASDDVRAIIDGSQQQNRKSRDLEACDEQNNLTCDFASRKCAANADPATPQELLRMPTLYPWNAIYHNTHQDGHSSSALEHVMPFQQWTDAQFSDDLSELEDSSGYDDLQIDADVGLAQDAANSLVCNAPSQSVNAGTAMDTVPLLNNKVLEMPSLSQGDAISHKQTNSACQSSQGSNRSVVDIQSTAANSVVVMPLQQWNNSHTQTGHHQYQLSRILFQESILQRIILGFGIGKLLQHILQNASISSWNELKSLCSIDNFAVEVDGSHRVMGVVMISPFLSLEITTRDSIGDSQGRDVGALITSHLPPDNAPVTDTSDCEGVLCHLLGALLHCIFSQGHQPGHSSKRLDLPKDDSEYEYEMAGPLTKKKSFKYTVSKSVPYVQYADFSQATSIVTNSGVSDARIAGMPSFHMNMSPLTEYGYPSSLSQLVRNLLNSGQGLFRPDNAYPSLDVAIEDMKLLFQRPNLFLFGSPLAKGRLFTSNRMYGRSNEIEALTNAFYRVASSGRSECIFVGGYSGCGKTALVKCLLRVVTTAGGYAVTRKLDEMQSSHPLTTILSAFNDLCTKVAQNSPHEILTEIHQQLIAAIGSNFIPLVRVLPNLVHLVPSHVTIPSLSNQHDTGFNFDRLCFTIQALMRVITSFSPPLLFFIDDLQWGCPMSLKLLMSVIYDVKGGMLFVGGFRDNEIGGDHALSVFFNTISASSDLTSSSIFLNGISAEDVNSMISDGLGLFPRLCKELSQVVHRKTNGNPFFVLEFLRSLIHRDLIVYSFRDKCWKWEIQQISAENITDNVLYLLSNKMHEQNKGAQMALKIAACFGISFSVDILKILTQKYHNLKTTVEEVLVKEGFVDDDGADYRFVHDKVREAAYSLMDEKERDQYHFDLGMTLLRSLDQNKEDSSILFAAVNQINRCPPTMIEDTSQSIAIMKLNYEAGVKSMECANFTSAHLYFKTGVSMLPEDTWKANYDFSLKINYHYANSSYCCGYYMEEALDTLENVIENGVSVDDKSKFMLDSYSLLVSLFFLGRKDLPRAFSTCLKVLNFLGEDLPNDAIDDQELVLIVTKVKALFLQNSTEQLLSLNEETTRRNAVIMEFYDQLVVVSYFFRPKQRLCSYFMARWAHFCLSNKICCKYTPGAFVSFSSLLCCEDLDDNARIGCRIGKIGMMIMSKRDDPDVIPGVYSVYYAYAGALCEPAHAVMDMLQNAYDIGMKAGDLSRAAMTLGLMTAMKITGGVNLVVLKKDIEHHLKLAAQHSQGQLRSNLLMYHEIVQRLIGNDRDESLSGEEDSPAWEESEAILQIFLSFYLGHMERVYFKAKLWEEQGEPMLTQKPPRRSIYIHFFSGLASASLNSKGKSDSQRHLSNLSRALSILEKASNFSEWNFKNKASLLKAVFLSITGKKRKAEREFNAAILASRSSKFVHEEGLSCETAAMYYKKNGNNDMAVNLFRQAQKCYQDWGSQMKVCHVARQIELLNG